jgi:hypothetical protein
LIPLFQNSSKPLKVGVSHRHNLWNYGTIRGAFPPGDEGNQHQQSPSRFASFSEARTGCGLTRSKAQCCQLIDLVGTKADPSD